jgi:hypothetical protein
MGHHVEFASTVIMLVFLAIALSAVGYGVSKLLHRVFDARAEEKMKAEGLVAAAKSRADARRAARA